jgi:hypothetical protein
VYLFILIKFYYDIIFLGGIEMENQKSVCLRAIEKYGTHKQLDRLIEDCSELIQAICRYKHYGMSDGVRDKLADVSIMIDQLNYSFCIDSIRNKKLERLGKIL